jgi:hypothetical protein
MNKFYNKLFNDANTAFNKNKDWMNKRDEYIAKCSIFNIDWSMVKDAFILQDEIAEEYLWKNYNNDFLNEIKHFINSPSPSIVISIYSNPIKNIESYSNSRKRMWKYKKIKINESLDELKEKLEKKCNVMIFNNYNNSKPCIEIQIILLS